MYQPVIGEIRAFAFGFAPEGWAPCNGQLVPIMLYPELFSILGTSYGGDGKTHFALPNLQGRAPIAPDAAGEIRLGSAGGEETHTLTLHEMPAHTHELWGSSTGTTNNAPDNVWGSTQAAIAFTEHANTFMHPGALETVGSSTPHSNMQPYLSLNYCIALKGVYPPRS